MPVIVRVYGRVPLWVSARVFLNPSFKVLELVTNFHETWSERHATDDNPKCQISYDQ